MFKMKTIGKPCAGKPHARFDEEVQNCSKESGSGFTLLVKKTFPYTALLRSLDKDNYEK